MAEKKRKKPLLDIIEDMQDVLEAEVTYLKGKVIAGEPFSPEDSERLGRAARLLTSLADTARKEAERGAKKGSELPTEEAIRQLVTQPQLRQLVMQALAETM